MSRSFRSPGLRRNAAESVGRPAKPNIARTGSLVLKAEKHCQTPKCLQDVLGFGGVPGILNQCVTIRASSLTLICETGFGRLSGRNLGPESCLWLSGMSKLLLRAATLYEVRAFCSERGFIEALVPSVQPIRSVKQ